MITPYYEREGITLYCGDCREIYGTLAPRKGPDLVLSDPPWGTRTAVDARRFTRRESPWWRVVDNSQIRTHEKIIGDDEEFDPSPWIGGLAILWGANNFAQRLPHSNGWLVWDKREGAESMAENGWPLGEAELAWTNVIGCTRVFRNLWSGLLRSEEKGKFYHPTQKPVRLMQWCIQLANNLCPDGIVIDPYCGAGSTLVAAKQLGRRAIGIEINEQYCEIAVKRLAQMVLPLAPPKEET